MSPTRHFGVLRATLVLALALLCDLAGAAETGHPLITLLRQEQHQGGSQTFDVARDDRGRLYFGNLEGLLLYDGAWWSKVEVPGEAVFRVQPDASGNVAITVLDGIGMLRRGSDGALEYQSLLDKLPPHLRDGIGQPQVCADRAGFLFVTSRFAARWDGKTMRILADHAADARPPRCFVTGDRTWIARVSGLEELGGPTRFVNRRVDLVLPDLVIVRGEGMFHLDGAPYRTDAAEWLRGKTVMDGRVLRDGRIVIATLRNGLLILTPDRRIDQIIGVEAGLPDDLLYAVVEDHEGALWLGMDAAIARVDVGLPLTMLDHRIGLRGGIHSVARHEGKMVAGTPHGVFMLDETPTGARARRIEGLDDVPWSMLSHGSDLLVGTYSGVHAIRDGRPRKIPAAGENLVYSMLTSERDPSLVWLGMEQGIGKLMRRGDDWAFEGPIPGSGQHIRTLAEVDGVLWAGSETDGITRIGADGAVRRFGRGSISVLLIDRRLVFIDDGHFVQLTPAGLFTPDPLLGHVKSGDFDYGVADRDGNVWVDSRPPRVIRRLAGRYEREPNAVGVMTGDVEHFFGEADGVMWLGSDRGLYRIAPAAIAVPVPQPVPLIHRVTAGSGRVLFDAISGGASAVTLPHDFGRLRIEVAPLSYRAGTSFQYRLDPIDTAWTPWTHQAFLDFTTLAPGHYTFRIRTRASAGGVSNEGRWSFTVDPPWYLTWWALLLWTAVVAATIAAMVRVRTQRLQRRAARLQELVDQQTVALRVANMRLEQANNTLEKLSLADPLTGVANRRYFDRALSDEWERASRRGTPLTLLLADLDHFKVLNDTQGHTAGDECLRRVAQYLQSEMRGADDLVARWGGEEFAILLPGSDEEAAVVTAERLRAGIEQHGVTASFGVATAANDADPRALLERADRALYAAKRGGRNRVHVESSDWTEDATA